MSSYPHALVGRPAAPPTEPAPAVLTAARAARAAEMAELVTPIRSAVDWRLAGSLVVLGDEANLANPGRDKASDGTIGDARHAATGSASDHNPWVVVDGRGVVRARDIDVDGLDLPTAFERARQAAAAGLMPQLTGGGYLILNERITTEDFTGWKVYKGTNKHVLHGHVSVSVNAAQFDDRRPWTIFQGTPAPAPAPAPPRPPAPAPVNNRLLEQGPDNYQPGDPRRQLLMAVQTRLRTRYPLYGKRVKTDGWFGALTDAAVREFQRRAGLVVDGVVGPATLAKLGL